MTLCAVCQEIGSAGSGVKKITSRESLSAVCCDREEKPN